MLAKFCGIVLFTAVVFAQTPDEVPTAGGIPNVTIPLEGPGSQGVIDYPDNFVEALLRLADVKASDFVVDISNGTSSTIIILAAQKYNAKGKALGLDEKDAEAAEGMIPELGLPDGMITFSSEKPTLAAVGKATVVFIRGQGGDTDLLDLGQEIREKSKPGVRVIYVGLVSPKGDCEEGLQVSSKDVYMTAERCESGPAPPTPAPGPVVFKLTKTFPSLKSEAKIHYTYHVRKPHTHSDSRMNGLMTIYTSRDELDSIHASFSKYNWDLPPYKVTAVDAHGESIIDTTTRGLKDQPVLHKLPLPQTVTAEAKFKSKSDRKVYFTYPLTGLDKLKDGNYELVPANTTLNIKFYITLTKSILGWWVFRDTPIPQFDMIVRVNDETVWDRHVVHLSSQGIGWKRVYGKLKRTAAEHVDLIVVFHEREREALATARINDWPEYQQQLTKGNEVTLSTNVKGLDLILEWSSEVSAHVWLTGAKAEIIHDVQIVIKKADGKIIYLNEQQDPWLTAKYPYGWSHPLFFAEEYGSVSFEIYYNLHSSHNVPKLAPRRPGADDSDALPSDVEGATNNAPHLKPGDTVTPDF